MTMLTSNLYPQKPHTLLLPANGSIPNNEKLPALIYTGVLPASDDLASTAEALLTRNGWPTEWRDIVLPYHHYHSTAHEVLAAVAGEGHLILGGEDGLQVIVRAGDVLVLPTGFGHKGGCHSDDFLLVVAIRLASIGICASSHRTIPHASAWNPCPFLPQTRSSVPMVHSYVSGAVK